MLKVVRKVMMSLSGSLTLGLSSFHLCPQGDLGRQSTCTTQTRGRSGGWLLDVTNQLVTVAAALT
jgi:hypothetical protein